MFKKKTPNYPAFRTNCMQNNISMHCGNTVADTASIGVVVAAQRGWWWYQCCKAAAWQHDGGDMRTRDYKVCNYKTDDEAELMEESFGDEGEDDDTFRK